MSNTWFDIQLNDVNNGNNEMNAESQISNNNNQLKCDSLNAYNELENNMLLNNNNKKNDNNNDGIRSESPFLLRENRSSCSSLSPNYSISENQFDFEVGVDIPNRGRISSLVDELLNDIYCNLRSYRNRGYSISSDSSYSTPDFQKKPLLRDIYLKAKGIVELKQLSQHLGNDVNRMNSLLLHHLRKRDRLSSQRSQYYDFITAALQAISPKRSVDTKMRFSIEPYPGDSGFSQWHDAMRMVSRLPGGIPQEFRKKLWITLAERHIQTRKINWSITSRFCFNDKGNPDDEALGAQIVKDLHRTGCSLFSGEESHNQALLKQVLLAYARWNKSVGYCQGFNMLAAIMLEVMEGNVEDSLKVMIYLIEGVLPESYFANNLRGLSVDMAVFRDLLRMRLSSLAKHFDQLQYEAQDLSTGASYEPPLINVFTMQWFLTLFSNCLPKSSVLRIWDLIFLEGNEVLLRAALAIWDCLADRILTVESADEFYSIMGVLTREMMEFGVTDTNELVKTICIMAPFPFPQLSELREKYIYNIRPLTSSFALVKKGLQIFQSDDEEEADVADDQMMLANWCITNAFNSNKAKDINSGSRTPSPSSATNSLGNCIGSTAITVGNATTNFLSANNIDPQRMTLDISLLKKQYAKLKERQQQAQVILTEGFQHANNSAFSKKEPLTMNHLLMGKTALIARRPKRPSPIIQSATRANFDPKKTLHGRSNTVANLFPQNTSINNNNIPQRKEQKHQTNAQNESIDRNISETLLWSQIKLDKKREKFQRKLSEPVLSVFNESSCEESPNGHCLNSNDNEVLLFNDNNNPKLKTESIESDNSEVDNKSDSSSTELCDDEHLNDSLSDFASSPEVSRKKASIQSSENNENNNSANIRSVDEASHESANKCLTEDNNCCDKSRCSRHSEPTNKFSNNSITTDHYIGNEDNDAYSSVKIEISELSLEECIQRLNEKISSLNDANINI